MAEYTPRFNRDNHITFTASAPIAAGQAVHITGAVRKLTTGPRIGLAHTSTNGGLVDVRD